MKFLVVIIMLVALPLGVVLLLDAFSRWSGTRDPQGYEWKAYSLSNGYRLEVAVPAPAGLDITLRPEKAFDRVAKALGIISEFQTGSVEFDRKVFIETDNPRFWMRLKYHLELREQILAALSWTAIGDATVRRLHIADGRLIVEINCNDKLIVDSVRASAEAGLLPTLKSIASHLDAVAAMPGAVPDRFARWARLLLVLGASLVVTGGMLVSGAGQDMDWNANHPFLMESSSLLPMGLASSLAALCVLLLLCRLLVGRSSRALMVLLVVLGLGVPGSFLISTFALIEWNERFDTSPAQEVRAIVEEKIYIPEGGGRASSGPTYRLEFSSRDLGVNGKHIDVTRDVWTGSRFGQQWLLETRAGALGCRWVNSAFPAPPLTSSR